MNAQPLSNGARLLLFLILLAAALLRWWQLSSVPPGLYYDEAYNGLDALDVLQTGPKLFFDGNTGREPLFIDQLSLWVAAFGRNAFALRLPATFFGVLTVAAVFAMTRTMLRGLGGSRAERIALMAAALLAVSHWQVDINRMVLRVNTMPLVAAIAFFLLWRAAHRVQVSPRGYLLAGAAFGFLVYTYISARIVPAVAAGLVALEVIFRPREPAWPSMATGRIWQRLRRSSYWPWLLGVVLVAAPLAAYYAFHLDLFLGRAAYVSALGPSGGGDRLSALRDSLLGNLMMFGQEGDYNWRHNLPGKPVFDGITYALFLLGVAVCLIRVRRGPFLMLLGWCLAMMLPGVVATDEYPHYTRVMGIVPLVFVLPALGADALLAGLARLAPLTRPVLGWPALAALPALALAGWTGLNTYHDYFENWAQQDDVYYAYSAEAAAAAQTMNALGNDPSAVFLLPFNFRLAPDYDNRTVDFLYTGRAPYRFVRVEEASLPGAFPSLLGAAKRAYVFRWLGGAHYDADPKRLVPFLLAQTGPKAGVTSGDGFEMTAYQIERPSPGTPFAGEKQVDAKLGDYLMLRGISAGPVPSTGPMWVVLRWETLEPPPVDLSVSVQVVDPAGKGYVQADQLLLSNDLFPSSRWQAGLPVATYLTLDGPPGAPGGEYQIRVVVYELKPGKVYGTLFPAATIRINPPPKP